MDDKNIDICISDARNFHNHGMYEDAISLLSSVYVTSPVSLKSAEVYKLLSSNYRKLGDYDMALININKAINITKKLRAKSSTLNEAELESAICLMNKGIIFEERGESSKAIAIYREALILFKQLHGENKAENGIIINSLVTLGIAYYNRSDFINSRNVLFEALKYFEGERETDSRYHAIINTINEIDGK